VTVFFIAEAGVNHNGREDLALAMIEAAARSGADAIKFQSFNADKLVTRAAGKATYQAARTDTGSQHEMLKALEMPEAMQRRLFKRCSAVGIEFMSTPFDDDALSFLVALGMRRIKIPSGEITNLAFLSKVAATGLPIIMSTGMADLNEVDCALHTIAAARGAAGLASDLGADVTVLHCTSNYPAQADDVNLRAMVTMSDAFRVPVGYSDHTLGVTVSIAAVAMGATVVEKHFTLDRALLGPDHAASLDPDELTVLVQSIRDVTRALGTPDKSPTKSELPVRALVRRSVTTRHAIATGEKFQGADLVLLRPGNGIAPADMNGIVGRRAARDIAVGETLQWSDIA
jgi:N,N'-diacetyllegionaminate synthase